jgi:hypothetical protein
MLRYAVQVAQLLGVPADTSASQDSATVIEQLTRAYEHFKAS